MTRRWAALLAVGLTLASCTMVGAPVGERPPARPADPTPAPAPGPGVRPGPPRAPAFSPVRTFPEVRALWVVRFTMTSPGAVRDMVARAAASGFNTVIVQVRGRGDAYYRSRLEPRAEAVAGPDDFDPLALTIEEAHARGIAVHAWVNTHLVWDSGPLPESDDHIVLSDPDWLAVPASLGAELHGVDPSEPRYLNALMEHAEQNLDRVEGIFTSPSHPAVEERVYSVWMDLVERYDVDGIHFDYVRFPSPEYDYSAGALRRFERWVAPRAGLARLEQLTAAARTDPFALPRGLPTEWDAFRREQIDGLVRRVYDGVKARRPEVVVSAAVVPSTDVAYEQRFQDWPRWLHEGVLDVVVPMAYTEDDATFRDQIRSARAAAGARERVWAGIGAYRNTLEGTLSKIEVARAEAAGGVVLFSYDWAVAEGTPRGSAPFLERVGAAAFGR